jgi:type I restriction enzyme, R subunit
MTTGYDCEDLLNVAFMRPVFSPTDFVQMKGRGTRLHDFREQVFDEPLKASVAEPRKKNFKLFDFFANCQYFEEEFDYDEVIALPAPPTGGEGGGGPGPGPGPSPIAGAYEHLGADIIASMKEEPVGSQGMKIDRMLFQKFEKTVKADGKIAAAVTDGRWDEVIDYVNREVFDKPEEYYTLDKLRRSAAVDRRITLREILQKVFGLIPGFKSKNDLLEEEFAKFVADRKPTEADALPAIKNFFKAYATSDEVRHIIDNKLFGDLATNPALPLADYKAVPEKYRTLVPEYIKDYVSLNQFAA